MPQFSGPAVVSSQPLADCLPTLANSLPAFSSAQPPLIIGISAVIGKHSYFIALSARVIYNYERFLLSLFGGGDVYEKVQGLFLLLCIASDFYCYPFIRSFAFQFGFGWALGVSDR